MSRQKAYELLLLTSLCLPFDAELKRYLYIAQITASEEYSEISTSKDYQSIYEEYLTPLKLSGYDVKKLCSVVNAIKILPTFLSELSNSIKCGCGPRLRLTDKPDFCNTDQLGELLQRIRRDSKGQNISNIDSSDFMLLFDETTIKSAETVFMSRKRKIAERLHERPASMIS